MLQKKIWLSSPHMGDEELNFIEETFKSNWIAPLGPNVNGFEQDLCDYTGIDHAAVLSSGTSAIHLALIMLGVKQSDEVICSSFTFSASANPIVYQGAIPVFVDSEENSWNLNPELLEIAIKDRISKGKKPKAIIVVHLYGNPAKIDEIGFLSSKYEIPIIEDAAEALGSEFNGQKLGTFGVIGILSFNGNKIITTSGGGALISNTKDYVEKARFLSTQARDDAPHYQHSQIGYNYRMSNVLAGIGRGQMKVLDLRVKQRRENYFYYFAKLSHFPGISFQPELQNAFSNKWLSCITIDPQLSGGLTRENIRLALEAENIDARPLWKPMHKQPIFEDYPFYSDGTSEKLFEMGLCLPSGSNLTKENLDSVIQTISDQFKSCCSTDKLKIKEIY